ncbi:MAG: helicase-related protein [Coriobacteriales bacterium]|nr:helicase-related protein [Coriobacteriales bacterium]
MTDFETFDNRGKILKDDLVARLRAGDRVAVAAAYFSIYGYQELKGQLEGLEELRFLYTEPTFLKAREDKRAREFYIPRKGRERGVAGTELEIRLRNELTQRAVARECAEWIRSKAAFRSLGKGQSFPQSFIQVESADDAYAYLPVEGITAPAIGAAPGSSPFTCIMRQGADVSHQLLALFDQAWEDESATEDVTEQVVESITNMYRENAPELMYYKALFELFNEFLESLDEDDLPKEATGFRDSKVWGMLYDFQRDAALAIISKLETYNGCILADSVGLGKTFTALAVIKYYEARNKDVLVLCPKKLSDNWMTYRNNQANNPIAADRLRYDVLYHTDLSRERGRSVGGIDLATFNWDTYDLVVIDESHNFRNGADNAAKNDDRENRYQKLMNKVIGKGGRTRVLMLSATPVNNRFRDLQNQLELAYRGNNQDWQEALGLRNDVRATFRNAQSVYGRWSKLEPEERTTKALMGMLDPDFFKLLDQVTVARSRRQIQRYYDVEAIGPFPKRLDPVTRRPDLSNAPDVGTFHKIAEALDEIKLASYVPSAYIQPSKQRKYEQVGLTFAGREWGLRRLMATNLLKRLESCVESFRLTLGKVTAAIEAKVALVNEFEHTPGKARMSVRMDTVPDLDLDDQNASDYVVGGKAEIALEDMDWVTWRRHMREDLRVLGRIASMVSAVDPAHDSKLAELKEIIRTKSADPINSGNRKVLVFTAFSDTADYLFEHVASFAKGELGLETAVVTGSTAGRTTLKGIPADTQSVLACFSPRSKEREVIAPNLTGKDVDVLIATDCISEGQNLQDCDCVVNYDIHWNPVRIVQRFGRVDRIGSHNERIQLVNFWPNVELDEYINLKARVETRMRITVMTSTGDDDLVNADERGDLEYRAKQIEQILTQSVDLEDVTGGVSITDLGLDEFRTDLVSWLKFHDEGEFPPHGTHAVVAGEDPGIVFVLRNVNRGVDMGRANRLHPFYLVYVAEDGSIVHGQLDARDTLTAMRVLCRGKMEPNAELCHVFNRQTKDGRDMRGPTRLLQAAVGSMVKTDESSVVDSFFGGGTSLVGRSGIAKGLDDFELLCFLVVM